MNVLGICGIVFMAACALFILVSNTVEEIEEEEMRAAQYEYYVSNIK